MKVSLTDLATRIGGSPFGRLDLEVSGIASIADAEDGELAFLAHPRYVDGLEHTRAQAVLVTKPLADRVPDSLSGIVVEKGHRALQDVAAYFNPPAPVVPDIHRTAVVGRGVELGEGVRIGAYAVLEDGVAVGSGARIGAHCVLGSGTRVGARTVLHPHVVLYEGTELGCDVVVHAGARIGADGFGYVEVEGVHEKIPHTGRCVIEDHVEIGANCTIDRGSIGETRIEEGVKLDNLVHIAHNVRVGARSLLAAQVGIAGSTHLGRGVWMGGQSGAINRVEIGDGARVVVQTGITRDVGAGETVSGFPARSHREELRLRALLGRLPGLRRRVRAVEERLADQVAP
ncbi:MAG: UDP-3-O-(3-hydroxymyristoyl)glucosamine N-acyltransferase [Gemmatimonadota bacterium]